MSDDLSRFLAEQMQDPAFAAAFEDAGERPRLALQLISLRKDASLTAEQVAERMEVKPKRVRDYESGIAVDVHLSFVQRYARAVGARLQVEVVNGG